MNWKPSLFKPKWQHKDADVRLAAVATEQDPQFIHSLVDIAGADEDSRVRCAAIKRLHQLENILKLLGSETDPRVIALLEGRVRQLSTSSDKSRPALELRMQVINATADRKLIEHLASHAPEAELRRAALAKVERQGLLGDCCIQDSDSENRHYAATRITQLATLKRAIEGLRKRDKGLYKQLQGRLHEELLARADPSAIHTEALNICAALEHLAIAAGAKDTRAIDARHAAWKRIAKTATADMTDRYLRICKRLDEPETKSAVQQPAVVESKPESEPQTSPVKEAPSQPIATRQTDDELSQTEKKLESDRERQRIQFEKAKSSAEDLLTQLGQELEQGELHKALATRAKIQQLGKGLGRQKGWQQVSSKLAALQGRLRELREWHHWSNNKIRKRLIAEMEVLPAADLHPDALLDRVKSLQAEWKTLEQSEQVPGEKHIVAAPWMWRKFSAAGHTAFDTAKPYLEKRSAIQSRHAQSLATFCAELEQLAEADQQDWTALGNAMNRGRKKLHDLNNVPAKQRKAFARQLKAALDKANHVMQDHYQLVEKEKMKLIRSASQLIHLPERSEAITQAKSLQSSWQSAGSLWRSKEQELWNQFRAHLDPLFEELKEQRETMRAAEGERLAVQRALCEELEAILKSGDDLSARHGIVQGLQDSWKDIERPERKLLAAFQALEADYRRQVKQAHLQKVNADRERWWLKSALLHELAVTDRVTDRTAKATITQNIQTKVKAEWPADSSDSTFETLMDKACEDFLAGKAADADKDNAEDLNALARTLCIRLEFVAGLPSPDEDRELRMQYQVNRLAESMSGESVRLAAVDEARDAEKAWLGMYALPEHEFAAFGKRIKQALETILEVN